MKQLAIIFLSCCIIQTAGVAQFYNSVHLQFAPEYETAAAALNDGFVFGFTQSDQLNKFHETIVLIKTNAGGKIIWNKAYDAGEGTSIKLINMIRTFTNEILISGTIGGDNNIITRDRCLVKINADGSVVWSKRFKSSKIYDFNGLVQLKDSSYVFPLALRQGNPVLVQTNQDGNTIAALAITNKLNAPIHALTAKGNTVDVIVGTVNAANISLANHAVNWQRAYNTSNQFTSLISSRCKNGDIIYLAGRNSGGFLSGTSRIFRTDGNGNLLWAKNISAAFDQSGDIFSVFDIVLQTYIHEDVSGNIAALVMNESTENLLVVFDASGNYLYNRVIHAPYNFITELSNGSYLNTCTAGYMQTDPLVSNRSFSTSVCDTAIFVTITNGTDSAAALKPMQFAEASITPANISLTVADADVVKNFFCNTLVAKAPAIKNVQADILPNPCINIVTVKTKTDVPFSVYNMSGILMLQSTTNHATDVSKLAPGLYMIEIKNKNSIERRTMIKR